MLGQHGVDVLDAGRVYVDLWVAGQRDQGAESSSVRRRLSALSSFYRYCAAHDLAGQVRLWVRRGLAGLLPGARSFRPGGFPRPGIFPGAGSGDYSIADLAGLFTVSRPTHRHRLQLDLPRMDHRPAHAGASPQTPWKCNGSASAGHARQAFTAAPAGPSPATDKEHSNERKSRPADALCLVVSAAWKRVRNRSRLDGSTAGVDSPRGGLR